MKIFTFLALFLLLVPSTLALDNHIFVATGYSDTIQTGEKTVLTATSVGLPGNQEHYIQVLLRDVDNNEIVDVLYSEVTSRDFISTNIELFANDYETSEYVAQIFTSVDVPFTDDPADGDYVNSSVLLTIYNDPEEEDHDFTGISVTANPTEGIETLDVSLTCLAYGGDGPANYFWDFDRDGTTDSTERITSHTYGIGTHKAKCTAVDIDGDTISGLSQEIIVTEKEPENIRPHAIFDMTPNRAIEGQTVNFDASKSYDEDGVILSYEWEIGLNDEKTGISFDKTFEKGIYTIKLTVTDNDGDSDSTQRVLIVDGQPNEGPVAIIEIDKNPAMEGDLVTIDGTKSYDPENDSLTYSWFIDGVEAGNMPSFTQQFKPGQYGIVLTVDDGKKTDSEYKLLTVNTKPKPVLEITELKCKERIRITSNQNCDITVRSNGNLVDGVKVELFKQVGDMVIQLPECTTESGTCKITYLDGSIGNFTVYAVATKQNYIADSDTYPRFTYEVYKPFVEENKPPAAIISIVPNPAMVNQEVTFDASQSSDPDGDTLLYTWYLEGIVASTEVTFTETFDSAEEIDVKLVVSDGKLTDDDSEVLVIQAKEENLPPTASISGPITTTEGSSATYDASGSSDPENGILYYIWRVAGNIVKQGFESFMTFTFGTEGDYEVNVEVMDDAGQKDSASITTKVIKEEEPEPEPEPEEDKDSESTDISFQKIRIFGHAPEEVRAGDFLQIRVGTYSDDVDDVYPSLIIPELGLKAKGQRSNINGKDAIQASIFIPPSTPEGYYMVRIGLTGEDSARKGEYRWFRVVQ